jgi:predicted AlkP superfamily pyrophosphatase or phosphodiesterase
MRTLLIRTALFTAFLVSAPFSVGEATPRLGVVIVLDQFCAEHLERYGHLFKGGLARLNDGGTVFAEAHHDHAMTLTATGHATISTGSYPNRHGVVGNHWVERATGSRVYSCDDSSVQVIGDIEADGRSPRHLMTDALGDWLKREKPGARVFAVSQKDRSAIMLGGRRPDGVFWFDDAKGIFVTSTYYMDSLPSWASGYDCFPFREKAIREGWTKGWPEEVYSLAHEDAFAAENDGFAITFPHVYDSSSSVARTPSEWLLETPFSDEMVLDFARELVSSESLGMDTIPDLLFVSMSATDYIGHSFGPHSHEVLDALLRADAYLAHFLSALDSMVGAGSYLVALSSDHGVMPLPEETSRQGEPAERILRAETKQHFEAAARQVADAIGLAQPLIIGQTNGLILDTKIAEEKGVRAPDLRKALGEAVAKLDFVEEVYTYEDLSAPGKNGDDYLGMYRKSFHPDRTPDLAVQFKENILVLDSRYGTTHGTPYRYDTHIPLIFWGSGIANSSKPVKDRVRTIDIAPTLAILLGLKVPEGIDGVILPDVFPEDAQ